MRRLEERAAIVTGAAHGIGKVYAQRLAEEGAGVVILDLDADAAQAVASELEAAGARAIAVAADVTDFATMQTMASRALEAFDRIDILVNNAAMFSRVPMSRALFEDINSAEWDQMMSVNLRGV